MPSENDINPFRVLGLPTSATRIEVVERFQELSAKASGDTQSLRLAMNALINHPFERLTYELFEYPDTQYEDVAWTKFVKQYRRTPAQSDLPTEPSTPDPRDLHIEAVITRLLEDVLESEVVDPDEVLKTLLQASPFLPTEFVLPLEVKDVIFG